MSMAPITDDLEEVRTWEFPHDTQSCPTKIEEAFRLAKYVLGNEAACIGFAAARTARGVLETTTGYTVSWERDGAALRVGVYKAPPLPRGTRSVPRRRPGTRDPCSLKTPRERRNIHA